LVENSRYYLIGYSCIEGNNRTHVSKKEKVASSSIASPIRHQDYGSMCRGVMAIMWTQKNLHNPSVRRTGTDVAVINPSQADYYYGYGYY
jgi:hypothetical protein